MYYNGQLTINGIGNLNFSSKFTVHHGFFDLRYTGDISDADHRIILHSFGVPCVD
jgi:hypothetical protein